MDDVPTFSVVGWDDFQHYKNRDPLWIKLHRGLLDNYGWAHLPDHAKAHLVGIWLLASRHNNVIPADPEWIAGRIGAQKPVDLDALVSAGFITMSQPASNVLADGKQVARLEKEKEKEEEKETETEAFETAWALYPKRPNNSKAAAKRAWTARRRANVPAAVLVEGVRRYAAYTASQAVDPRFIKQASTFFGPDEHYLADFTIPANGHLSDRERRTVAAMVDFAGGDE